MIYLLHTPSFLLRLPTGPRANRSLELSTTPGRTPKYGCKTVWCCAPCDGKVVTYLLYFRYSNRARALIFLSKSPLLSWSELSHKLSYRAHCLGQHICYVTDQRHQSGYRKYGTNFNSSFEKRHKAQWLVICYSYFIGYFTFSSRALKTLFHSTNNFFHFIENYGEIIIPGIHYSSSRHRRGSASSVKHLASLD